MNNPGFSPRLQDTTARAFVVDLGINLKSRIIFNLDAGAKPDEEKNESRQVLQYNLFHSKNSIRLGYLDDVTS